jgi:hypothetical protein
VIHKSFQQTDVVQIAIYNMSLFGYHFDEALSVVTIKTSQPSGVWVVYIG